MTDCVGIILRGRGAQFQVDNARQVVYTPFLSARSPWGVNVKDFLFSPPEKRCFSVSIIFKVMIC